jgi:hypothetical protein
MAVISPGDTAARLIAGEASAVQDAIGYLESDPWEYRSGYAKATLLRRLKHIELAELDKVRLQTVLLHYVDVGARWDFREACTLARHLDSVSLRAGLRSRLHGANVSVARRALMMLLRLRHSSFSPRDLDRARAVLVEWAAGDRWIGLSMGGRVRRLWSPDWGRALTTLAETSNKSPSSYGARRLLRTVPTLAQRAREADPRR